MTAEDESYLAFGEAAGSIGKRLLHKGVVPEIGVGIRDDSEKYHDRKTESVGQIDGEVERGVVVSPLGSLHPVDDASALREAGAADGDSIFVNGEDGSEVGHGFTRVQQGWRRLGSDEELAAAESIGRWKLGAASVG
jgi:hypothetical protein